MCIAIMHIRIYTYDNKHVMKYCDVRTNVMYVCYVCTYKPLAL